MVEKRRENTVAVSLILDSTATMVAISELYGH